MKKVSAWRVISHVVFGLLLSVVWWQFDLLEVIPHKSTVREINLQAAVYFLLFPFSVWYVLVHHSDWWIKCKFIEIKKNAQGNKDIISKLLDGLDWGRYIADVCAQDQHHGQCQMIAFYNCQLTVAYIQKLDEGCRVYLRIRRSSIAWPAECIYLFTSLPYCRPPDVTMSKHNDSWTGCKLTCSRYVSEGLIWKPLSHSDVIFLFYSF